MTELHPRPYRADDAAAVADLINVVSEAGGWHGGHIAAEIDDLVANEVKDVATDTRLVVDGQGRLVAVGFAPLPPEGGDRVELIGGVHPDRRGAGLGRELLAWQLDRAAARRAEIAPDTPWLGQVAVGVGDTSAIRLFERFGFTVARHFLEMTAPTTPPPAAVPVEGVRTGPYDKDQDHELYAVHMAAFGELWGHQDRSFEAWAAQTVGAETFLPGLARVARAGDAIVGYLLPYDRTPGRFYVGQIGTAASWRRRGVGSLLLAEALAAAGPAGYTHAGLDADADNPTGAAGVYEKVGFVRDQHVVLYHKPV